MSTQWIPTIGLEVHVQLLCSSKAFCDAQAGWGKSPNTQIDPLVLALPGALPVFNQKALHLALRLALATDSVVPAVTRFARKHYFYPDLPKGYQISQADEPLCEYGKVWCWNGKTVQLRRIHLEEDAGKSTHVGHYSLVDLNRAGVPLVEVVTDPVIDSAEEAADFMRSLHQLVRVLGVSDGDMEKGQMRCDANVSVRPSADAPLGTRTELKNINSFRFVQKAIEHEIARQIEILESGGKIVQETRLWDADRGLSFAMRSKEDAVDYRYIPDPDLPPLPLGPELLAEVRRTLPELPKAHRERLQALGLSVDDAWQLISDTEASRFFDATMKHLPPAQAKTCANWMLGELSRELNSRRQTFAESTVTPEGLAELLLLIADGSLSGNMAKSVLPKMLDEKASAKLIAERDGLRQVSDVSAIHDAAQKVLAASPKQVADYQNGNVKILGYLVGQVMKAMGGSANPKAASEALQKLLDAGKS